MRLSELAKRYVQALSGLELKGQSLRELSQELSTMSRLYQTSPELYAIMENPGFTPEERRRVLDLIMSRMKVSTTCQNVIHLLCDKHRTRLLPEIAFRLEQRTEIGAGMVSAELITATQLKKAQLDRFTRILTQMRGAPVKVTTIVKPEIIGGAMVQMEGRIYNGSVRRRLALMREGILKEG